MTAIEIVELAPDEAVLALERVAPAFEKHHEVRFAPEAVAAAVAWSARYIPERPLPDKAVAILDLAGARARRRGAAEVTREQIADVLAESCGVPVERLLETDGSRMLRFEELLASRIVGHKEPIERIARVLRRNASGFRSQRPIGSFLLLGPTGVGKTETAKAIAECLFHSPHAMTRLDLSEYAEAHAIARLVGAPPGYVGHEAGGQLTEAVRKRPYQVLLLDEIEKAHRDVLEAFLQVFDDGRMTDGRGRTIDFTNVVIVMTSNIGADVSRPKTRSRIGFGATRERDTSAYEEAMCGAARAALAPELYNRIDEVLAFAPLDRRDVGEVAARMLRSLGEELEAARGVRLDVSPAAIDALLDEGGFDEELGARPMRRAIARLIEAPIAEMILKGELERGDVAMIDVEHGKIVVDAVRPHARAVRVTGAERSIPADESRLIALGDRRGLDGAPIPLAPGAVLEDFVGLVEDEGDPLHVGREGHRLGGQHPSGVEGPPELEVRPADLVAGRVARDPEDGEVIPVLDDLEARLHSLAHGLGVERLDVGRRSAIVGVPVVACLADHEHAELREREDHRGVVAFGRAIEHLAHGEAHRRAHRVGLRRGQRRLVEQGGVRPRHEPGAEAPEARHRVLGGHRASHEVHQHRRAARSPEDVRLRREAARRLRLEGHQAVVHLEHARHHPLGVRAQGGPHLVLAEEALGDEGGAGVPAERGELRPEAAHRLARQVAARSEEREQGLVAGRGGRGHDVAVAQDDPTLDAVGGEAQRRRRAERGGVRDGAGRVSGVEDRRQDEGRAIGSRRGGGPRRRRRTGDSSPRRVDAGRLSRRARVGHLGRRGDAFLQERAGGRRPVRRRAAAAPSSASPWFASRRRRSPRARRPGPFRRRDPSPAPSRVRSRSRGGDARDRCRRRPRPRRAPRRATRAAPRGAPPRSPRRASGPPPPWRRGR